jgi:hypothetical protein
MMKNIDETTGRNPFKVPDNYFEDVNRKIISETSGAEDEISKWGFYAKLRPYFAIAASFAVLAILSFAAVKLFVPADKTRMIPEISLQEFSESYLNDIDILTLEENVDFSALSEVVPDISRSEIIDYLILDNIDINEIYELL